jgi:hypothetical protein
VIDPRTELITILTEGEDAIRRAMPEQMDPEEAMDRLKRFAFEAEEKYFAAFLILLAAINRTTFYQEAMLNVAADKYGVSPEAYGEDVVAWMNERLAEAGLGGSK